MKYDEVGRQIRIEQHQGGVVRLQQGAELFFTLVIQVIAPAVFERVPINRSSFLCGAYPGLQAKAEGHGVQTVVGKSLCSDIRLEVSTACKCYLMGSL